MSTSPSQQALKAHLQLHVSVHLLGGLNEVLILDANGNQSEFIRMERIESGGRWFTTWTGRRFTTWTGRRGHIKNKLEYASYADTQLAHYLSNNEYHLFRVVPRNHEILRHEIDIPEQLWHSANWPLSFMSPFGTKWLLQQNPAYWNLNAHDMALRLKHRGHQDRWRLQAIQSNRLLAFADGCVFNHGLQHGPETRWMDGDGVRDFVRSRGMVMTVPTWSVGWGRASIYDKM